MPKISKFKTIGKTITLYQYLKLDIDENNFFSILNLVKTCRSRLLDDNVTNQLRCASTELSISIKKISSKINCAIIKYFEFFCFIFKCAAHINSVKYFLAH